MLLTSSPIHSTVRFLRSARNFCSTIHNESLIARINNLNNVAKLIDGLDPNALVAFDVDKTLIIPKDVLATDIHYATVEKTIKYICNDLKIDENRASWYQSMIYLNSKKNIIDPESLELLKTLNQKKIKVIALTALSRGSYGTIPDVLQWRIDEMKRLGYNFETGFNLDQCFQFKDKVPDALPAFRSGVLFSSYAPKGKILEIFLNRLQWKPSEIVFVDDQFKHVQSVVEITKKMGIKSHCFHYVAAEKAGQNLNIKQSELQIRHLVKQEKWLSDEEILL